MINRLTNHNEKLIDDNTTLHKELVVLNDQLNSLIGQQENTTATLEDELHVIGEWVDTYLGTDIDSEIPDLPIETGTGLASIKDLKVALTTVKKKEEEEFKAIGKEAVDLRNDNEKLGKQNKVLREEVSKLKSDFSQAISGKEAVEAEYQAVITTLTQTKESYNRIKQDYTKINEDFSNFTDDLYGRIKAVLDKIRQNSDLLEFSQFYNKITYSESIVYI